MAYKLINGKFEKDNGAERFQSSAPLDESTPVPDAGELLENSLPGEPLDESTPVPDAPRRGRQRQGA